MCVVCVWCGVSGVCGVCGMRVRYVAYVKQGEHWVCMCACVCVACAGDVYVGCGVRAHDRHALSSDDGACQVTC